MTMRAKRRRGVVMILVLASLLMLSLLTASYFTRAGEGVELANSVVGQQIADSNANFGLQQAIADLRAGGIPVDGLAPCIGADVSDLNFDPESCPNGARMPPPPGTPLTHNGASWQNGGGLFYRIVVVKPPPQPGIPNNRYLVQSTGYYGADLRSPNLITSIIRAEIDMGARANFRCLDDYDCH